MNPSTCLAKPSWCPRWTDRPRKMLRAAGSRLRPSGLWAGRGGETRGPTRVSSPRSPPSFFFLFPSAGVRSATTRARCPQTASTSVRKRYRPPPCSTWRHHSGPRAQVSIKKGGFGIRDLVLHSPAAFLASSSSTAALCNSLCDSHNATPDPRCGCRWSTVSTPHGTQTAQSTATAFCPTCVTLTHWTP